MDPDEALATLRNKVQDVLQIGYNEEVNVSADEAISLLVNIAEVFDGLDKFITNGGFRPKAWQ